MRETEEAIKLIECAIELAIDHRSKMDDVAWSVPALSSLKIRHLMNNLGAISTRYFECGVHVGGLFCSTIRNNHNLRSATANDSFASDVNSDNPAEPRFWENARNCISQITLFEMLKANTFDVPPNEIINPIDLYLFDADHSYESQRKAVTHFLPAMADEFIMCVDDWQYGDVKRGTLDGLAESGCEILYERELLNEEPYTEDEHRNMEWWRGYALFLLKKK